MTDIGPTATRSALECWLARHVRRRRFRDFPAYDGPSPTASRRPADVAAGFLESLESSNLDRAIVADAEAFRRWAEVHQARRYDRTPGHLADLAEAGMLRPRSVIARALKQIANPRDEIDFDDPTEEPAAHPQSRTRSSRSARLLALVVVWPMIVGAASSIDQTLGWALLLITIVPVVTFVVVGCALVLLTLLARLARYARLGRPIRLGCGFPTAKKLHDHWLDA